MTTKEMLFREISKLSEAEVEDLYRVVKDFLRAKARPGKRKNGIMAKLKRVKFRAPADLSRDHDLYVIGEKHA